MRYLLAVLLVISGAAHAYRFGDGSIEIPEGFEGPVKEKMGRNGTMTAFKRPHETGKGALLQITAWEPDEQFSDLSTQRKKKLSKRYLLQFLGGIERRRDSFERDSVEFVRISGEPTAKVDWRWEVQGQSVHGVMYCLIVNSTIYSFQTQDLARFDGKYTAKAVDAFESVELDGR